jgi:hydrogenase expression/formation protein HypC
MCLGVPGRLVERDERTDELVGGVVEFAGVRRRVSLACVPDARPGDHVIVHAGIAISVVDPDEAERVLGYLKEIGEIEEGGPGA